MAGKLRYWKEKDGRFWARIAVPERLRPFLDHPRSELLEPLGGDRRTALRLHPAAVARLQHEIVLAEQRANTGEVTPNMQTSLRAPISTADFGRAIWQRYTAALEADDAKRLAFPNEADSEAELAKLMMRAQAGEFDINDPLAVLDASLDYLHVREARRLDQFARKARLAALQRELVAGETHQVEHEINDYLDRRGLFADEGTAERKVLAKHMMRAEIEFLKRTIERDRGDYSGQPSDPIVKAPPPEATAEAVSIAGLWDDYIKSRVQAGFSKDGGKRQAPVIKHLRTFLKHDDARRVTKKDLIAWREHLMNVDKLAAKTVSDIYLSTVRSLFSWAHENEHLPENIAQMVRQPKPRKVDSREKGYTDAEAVAVLRASRSHVSYSPKIGQ